MKTKEQAPKTFLQPSAHDAAFSRTAGSSAAPPALQFKSEDSNLSSSGEPMQMMEIPDDEIAQTKADQSIQRQGGMEEEEALG